MTTLPRCAAAVALLAITSLACTGFKAEPDDDLTGLSLADLASDEKYDHGANLILLLGELGYGETSPSVSYDPFPRFRAYQFQGGEGDEVEIWVRGLGSADAVAYLLDEELRVLAWNDDASPTTWDAQLLHTLPAAGTYYIVFRDYYLSSERFRVSLAGAPAGGCLPEGAEPNRNYVARSPETCAVIRFYCPEGSWYFASECGCGCEQDQSCPHPIDCKPPTDCSELIERCPLSTIAG
jgi:hypothetical protein